jgi:PAS domain S-box-containing protein
MKNGTNPKVKNKSDIIELTQHEESEGLFRNTFEQAADGIAHVGTNSNFIRVNQKFRDIVRYSLQELLKLTFQNITDDLATDLNNVQKLLDKDIDTYSMEKQCFRNNRTFIIELNYGFRVYE